MWGLQVYQIRQRGRGTGTLDRRLASLDRMFQKLPPGETRRQRRLQAVSQSAPSQPGQSRAHLSHCLSDRWSVCVHLRMCLSVSFVCVCLCLCLCLCLSVCLSGLYVRPYMFICIISGCLSVCLSVCIPVFMYVKCVCLHVTLSVRLCACQSIYLSGHCTFHDPSICLSSILMSCCLLCLSVRLPVCPLGTSLPESLYVHQQWW